MFNTSYYCLPQNSILVEWDRGEKCLTFEMADSKGGFILDIEEDKMHDLLQMVLLVSKRMGIFKKDEEGGRSCYLCGKGKK